MRPIGALSLLILAACDGSPPKDTATVTLSGPVLEHTVPDAVPEGTPVEITVTATDDDGVSDVSLYHRVTGVDEWAFDPMAPGEGDTWTATLDAGDVRGPSVEYYFKAVDGGDTPASSYLPEESTSAPFVLPVSVQGLPLPFVEDFEIDEADDDLNDLGWRNASEGFLDYEWALSTARAHGGSMSVFHSRGYSGTPAMEDWLISPPLDFSQQSDAQVTWWEYGVSAAEGTHGLYVSTGSRDPADGDYVPVQEALPTAPEGAWGRSAVVDLSQWAGQPTVYLAWLYQGVDADDWSIDDVRVESLQPELSATEAVDPSPISPGQDGTLTVTVSNTATVAASDVSVSVAFPSGGASVGTATTTIPAIAAGGSEVATFDLHIDEATPNDSHVPLTVSVASGDQTVTLDDPLLVGLASTADIVYTPSAAGSLELVLGVGDPDAPTWEETVYSDDAEGTVTLSVDITDQWDLLPPAAGDLRWFVRASPEVDGQFDSFSVTYDGTTYSAVTLPTVPATGDEAAYVPSPPEFVVTGSTTPSTVAPGDAGVTLTVSVENDGASTSGPVTATLASTDPDVTITDAGPLALSTSAMGTGDVARLTSAFAFSVSDAHTNSSPVDLQLVLADDLESWSVPLSVDVPFPVMHISGVTIDDDGHDSVLDADESADLEFRVTNTGDLASTGIVYGTVSLESTSTAAATLSTNTVSYGSIGAGNSKTPSRPFTIDVTSGAAGDTLDLLLTLTDSARTYEARQQLILGEPPWTVLDTTNDPTGDALNGWDFDIVSGEYRVYDGQLEIRLTSATPYDPSDLFIEAWGISSGADWDFYRLLLQSGVVAMQGYGSSGFVTISTPTVTYDDAYTITFSISVADLGLLIDDMTMGFATGWCGPDEYYCDHYPDGWGYAYVEWDPSLFFDMSW